MGARCRITVFALIPLRSNRNKMFFHCSQNTGFQLFRKTRSSHKRYLQFGAPYMLLQALQLNHSSWFEKDWVTYRSFPVPGQECPDLAALSDGLCISGTVTVTVQPWAPRVPRGLPPSQLPGRTREGPPAPSTRPEPDPPETEQLRQEKQPQTNPVQTHPGAHRGRDRRAVLPQRQLTGTGHPSNTSKCPDTQDSPYLSPVTSAPGELACPWEPRQSRHGGRHRGWAALPARRLFALFNTFRTEKKISEAPSGYARVVCFKAFPEIPPQWCPFSRGGQKQGRNV